MSKMTVTYDLRKSAMDMLLATSRTFFIPISRLSPGLQEAVTSAYLCMRAIDEIEDHPLLPSKVKISLLRSICLTLQKPLNNTKLSATFHPYRALLPEVTLRLFDWIKLCPSTIVSIICNATATMSKGMADWVYKDWQIKNEEDLDRYTFCVAGSVGTLLSDLWLWHEDLETDKNLAVAFGRGLQAVNIIRNRSEDLSRGVNFFPDGWEFEDMFLYAQHNLTLADVYLKDIRPGPILTFCKIPLVLAHGTLDTLAAGEAKLSRAAVAELVSQVARE
jgi:farnesyl-diphosphate farnesyltransferase